MPKPPGGPSFIGPSARWRGRICSSRAWSPPRGPVPAPLRKQMYPLLLDVFGLRALGCLG